MAVFDKIKIDGVAYTVKDTATSEAVSRVASDLADTNATVKHQGLEIDKLKNKKSGIYADVRDYGAVGDGVTDDTEAIQTAIDSENNLFFSPGTYSISGTVTLPNSKHLIADSATILQKQNNTNSFRINNTSEISIDGLYFKAENRPAAAGDNSYAIAIYGCNDVAITNCYFENFTSGVYSEDAGNFYNKNLRVENCTFNKYSFGILVAQCYNLLLKNNIGINVLNDHINTSSSQLDPPHLIYGTDRSSQLTPQNIYIINNTEIGNRFSESFKFRNANNLLMSGNVSTGCCRGIELASVTNAVVSNNIITGMIEPPETDTKDCAFHLYDVKNILLADNFVDVNKGVSKYIIRTDLELGEKNSDITVVGLVAHYSNQEKDYKNVFNIQNTDRFTAKNITLHNKNSFNRRMAGVSNNSTAFFDGITATIENFSNHQYVISETDNTSTVNAVVALNQVPATPTMAGNGTNNLTVIKPTE